MACVLAPLCLVAAQQKVVQQNGSSNGSSQYQQPTTPKNGQSQSMMNPKKADCSQLSTDEQDFANQLNPTNKMVFCGKFDADMRQSAMGMAGQMGTEGMLMTNDQAVEKTAKDNNIMAPAAPARQGSGCPAK